MTAMQRWMYRSLLQAAFFCSERPYLPNEDEVLWIHAGCDTLQQWLDNKVQVLRRFQSVERDGVQLLHHKRVAEDWNRLMEKREAMALLGQRSADAKAARSARTTSVERTLTPSAGSEVSEVKGSEVKESKSDAAAAPLSEQGKLQEGQPGYYAEGQWSFLTTPPKVFDRLRKVWQDVVGKAAMFRKPQGKGWDWFTDICGQYEPDVLVPAFELWVDKRGKFNPGDSPVMDFLRDEPKAYTQQVLPLNTFGKAYVEPTFTDEEKHQQREQHLKNFNATLPELEAQLQDLVAGLNMFRGGMSPECIANDEAQIALLEKMIAEEREYIARREQTQAGRAA
jgi:hypothetical protein